MLSTVSVSDSDIWVEPRTFDEYWEHFDEKERSKWSHDINKDIYCSTHYV